MKSLLRSPPMPPLTGGSRRPRRLRLRRSTLSRRFSTQPPCLPWTTWRTQRSIPPRDPACPPAAVPAAHPPAAVLLLTIQTHAAAVVPALRDFRMVHPPAAAVHPRQLPPAAAVIPPLLLKGRPVPRCRTSSTPTRAIASQPAPNPLNSQRRCTDRAGGTSLYHFAAILPRTSPVRGRSRPEELIPPPPPPPGGSYTFSTVVRLRGRPGATLRSAPPPSACRKSAPPGPPPRAVSATAHGRQAARQQRAPPGLASTSAPAPPVLSGPRARPWQFLQLLSQPRHAGQDLKS